MGVLIHNPTEEAGVDEAIWAGLIETKKAGLVKHIGVSNFGKNFIEKIWNMDKSSPPEVLQTYFSPWSDEALRTFVKWCLSRSMRVTAIGSLGGSKFSLGSKNKPVLSSVKQLTAKYKVTAGQVLLRWALDQGVDVIPGS